MGAKHYTALLALLAVGGCADWARFAPPGIVKYEELAGDEPANPAIVERVAERNETHDAVFPNLSQQPGTVPEGIAADVRGDQATALRAARENLTAGIAADRAAAEAELTGDPGLIEAADALAKAVERDAREARRERKKPLVAPNGE